VIATGEQTLAARYAGPCASLGVALTLTAPAFVAKAALAQPACAGWVQNITALRSAALAHDLAAKKPDLMA
jgi:hypothetical protein